MCILVVLILYFSMKKNATMLPDEKVFRILLLAAAAVLMCDAVGWVLDGQPAGVGPPHYNRGKHPLLPAHGRGCVIYG